MKAWSIAWALATPLAVLIGPIARKLATNIIGNSKHK
jgi:hypothetical protein